MMLGATCLSRTTSRAPHAARYCRNVSTRTRPQTRAAIHPYAQRRQQHFVRSVAAVTALWGSATAWQWYHGGSFFREVHAEEPPEEKELNFEQPRRQAAHPEDNRAIISSQHLQVTKSWENPGLYAWGSNSGKVVAPDSDEAFVKTPRRMPFFDGVLLRDIKLDRNFAAAIDEKGDLLQWGTAFSNNAKEPTRTLRGHNLVSIAISRDRIIALSKSGKVYSIPVSREEQKNGPKPPSTSYIPFWGGSNDISYRDRTPSSLGWNERVISISSGLDHALVLTSSGRVFSFASGNEHFPSKGQLGVPGLSWENRPAGSFDLPHEVSTLKGFPISKIAAGDYHSLVCDSGGRAFGFGDNSSGQLGLDFNPESLYIDAPSLLPTHKLYSGTAQTASVTNVFAGGNTSFVTIDAVKNASSASPSPRDLGRITADTWAFGFGLTGQLATGRWTHTQSTPTKVPAFSGLFEWDETTNSVVPIRLAYLSIGASHAAAVMANIPSVVVPPSSSPSSSLRSKIPLPLSSRSNKLTENDTNWGRDILFWGNNEFYQIGTGKRNNVSTPTYLQPLDQRAEEERSMSVFGGWGPGGRDKEKEMHRFQITARSRVRLGSGRTVEVEQKVECGRGVTAVYSAV
ncbi:regulator of chromosome condensation 1/beta-lactamase-inhibitor protein II [Clohesyomyces aquaticus]|uniref:Regulator of chromosome condensation 1/beta-lactamase-inhibitor protein II n=1 Tax=Clohesyomyces aquaticus TaxID=1231657 RepID=A0A1Y1ZRB6_9PLEO|nr:regulator of chromosome condensation 1/beta-lactamase-inhibitor protein II [Clohesyomyces aquaticus]